MAEYCIIGYLNIFVENESFRNIIIAWFTTHKRGSHQDAWQAIQDSGLNAIYKALEPGDIHKILDWMVEQGLLGKPENSTITYTLSE